MTRRVVVGGVPIGGGAPVVVQSMTNTNTADVAATVAQIQRLEAAGCEIARVAVPDFAAAEALPEIRRAISIPLVADIHFDCRLALAAIDAGVDKLRLNPGNITDPARIGEVAEAAVKAAVPIRVGANSGSLAKEYLDPHGRATAAGMVESALREIRLLEGHGVRDIVVSLKATDVRMTVDAYRAVAAEVEYPLHIGITEAGTAWEGAIRSAVGLGILLAEGIGDTVRVSLAGDPVDEVRAAYEILRSLGLRQRGVDLHVCPTCGRTGIDLARIADEVRRALADVVLPVKVALMGCVVNGLGEVKGADVGLVGSRGQGTIYVGGEPTATAVPEDHLVDEVAATVRTFVARRVREGGGRG
ncbi:MAG: flavodoxin-dependent (E)-4-hydroxy-3-methylbut-2-enyl-diphosphate synthase [Candidatus Bipolaricaulis sp.]|nr:flavodoxin-dependent (E)-4-hydroxy-3-methylbut-2-enyl-diphosphate synthase [Candidatus Bipolaricaulis sp.]